MAAAKARGARLGTALVPWVLRYQAQAVVNNRAKTSQAAPQAKTNRPIELEARPFMAPTLEEDADKLTDFWAV